MKKTLGILILIAMLMLSPMLVATPIAKADPDTFQFTLKGWTLKPKEKWTKGLVRGYSECEWIPFKLTIKNLEAPQNVVIDLDYMITKGSRTGAIGIDAFRSMDETPWKITVDGVTTDVSSIEIFHFASKDTLRFSLTVPAGAEILIKWESHLALTVYDGTTITRMGASFWPGGRMHVHAGLPEMQGLRSVPIMRPLRPEEAEVSGIKFYDINANHNLDSDEVGLAGWTIQLWKLDGDPVLVDTTTTGPDGEYIFTVTAAGTYKVTEVLQSGWEQTAPHPDGYYQITVVLGNAYTDKDFGNHALGPTAEVTFAQVGVGIDFDGTVLTVDSVTYGVDDLPVTFIWPSGYDHTFEYHSPLVVDAGKRYVWISTSGLSTDQSGTITAPSGGGSVTGYYKTQFKITVTATPSEAIGGTFKVTYTSCGTIYTDVEKTTEWTEWVDADTDVTVSDPQEYVPSEAGVSGVRYKFDSYDPSDSVTMTEAKTITLVYKTQYYLTVNTNPAEVLTLNPSAVSGEGWYDSGATATVDAVQNVDKVADESRYDFRSWTGATPTGVGNQATVYMDDPKTATANYQLQYYLTLATSPPGVNTPTGEGWYDADTYATISTDEYVDIVPGSSRYRFDGWTTTDMDEIGVPSATSTTVLMDKAKTVTANYVTQYYLTVVTNPVGLDSPTGAGWYDAGTYASISTTSPVSVAPYTYFFAGWTTGDMTEIANQYALSTTVYMDKAKTVTANYVRMIAPTGGKTMGFWTNKNGQALLTLSDATYLNTLAPYAVFTAYPKEPTGSTPFSATDLTKFRSQVKGFLLNANAVDMRYMLAAQLLATELNVQHGFLSSTQLVWVDANHDGVFQPGEARTIGGIMNDAITQWTSGTRATQEYVKNLLDQINNNQLWFLSP